MLFDMTMTDPVSIEYWQNHVGYSGIQYINVDLTQARKWFVYRGNKVRWESFDNFRYILDIEEIYIGNNYTMIVSTTTERIALWFSNATEVRPWESAANAF